MVRFPREPGDLAWSPHQKVEGSIEFEVTEDPMADTPKTPQSQSLAGQILREVDQEEARLRRYRDHAMAGLLLAALGVGFACGWAWGVAVFGAGVWWGGRE